MYALLFFFYWSFTFFSRNNLSYFSTLGKSNGFSYFTIKDVQILFSSLLKKTIVPILLLLFRSHFWSLQVFHRGFCRLYFHILCVHFDLCVCVCVFVITSIGLWPIFILFSFIQVEYDFKDKKKSNKGDEFHLKKFRLILRLNKFRNGINI